VPTIATLHAAGTARRTMEKPAADNPIEVPAQASLLDVVCNFVAILIVLVMIGAVYAKRGTAPR